MIGLLLIWIPFGSLFLIVSVMKDMFYFVKILCDFKDEGDLVTEKKEADEQ